MPEENTNELDLFDEFSHGTDYWRACSCVVRRRISLLSEDVGRHYNSAAKNRAEEIGRTGPTNQVDDVMSLGTILLIILVILLLGGFSGFGKVPFYGTGYYGGGGLGLVLVIVLILVLLGRL